MAETLSEEIEQFSEEVAELARSGKQPFIIALRDQLAGCETTGARGQVALAFSEELALVWPTIVALCGEVSAAIGLQGVLAPQAPGGRAIIPQALRELYESTQAAHSEAGQPQGEGDAAVGRWLALNTYAVLAITHTMVLRLRATLQAAVDHEEWRRELRGSGTPGRGPWISKP